MGLQAFGAGQTGRIRIGAGEFFGATFVPRAIAALRERYPQLGFELHSGLTELNYPRLLAGKLDLHFGMLPQVEPLPIKRLFAVLEEEAGEGKVGVSVELTSLAAMVQLLQAGPYLACFAEGLPLLQPQLGLAILAYPKPIWQHQAGVVMHRSLARYAPARELVEHVKGAAAGLAKGTG